MAGVPPHVSTAKRILIVDDERALATYFSELLTSKGHITTSFTDPVQALNVFTSEPDQFDLVLSDIQMPSMRGEQLAQQIINSKPGVAIILCSGYSPDVDEKTLFDIGVKAYLQKPVDTKALLQLIDEATPC